MPARRRRLDSREDRVNGVTIRQCRCPRCGQAISIPDPPRALWDNPDADIESLRQEIRRLRETVACLRGTLGWRETAPRK